MKYILFHTIYINMGGSQTHDIGDFDIVLNDPFTLAGQCIEGSINVFIMKAIRLTRLTYVFKGEEMAEIDKSKSQGLLLDLLEIAADKKSPSKEFSECIYSICNDQSDIPFAKENLLEGKYSLPFNIPTRTSYPSSYFENKRGITGRISYNLSVEAQVNSSDIITKKVLVQIMQKPTTTVTIRSEIKDLRNFCFFKKGTSTVQCEINSCHISPYDQLKVCARCHSSNKEIPQRVYARLVRSFALNISRNHSYSHRELLPSIKLNNSESINYYSGSINLSSLTHVFTQGKCVSNSYSLEVYFDYPWRYTHSLSLPINVSHKGSVSVNWKPSAEINIPPEDDKETPKPKTELKYAPSNVDVARQSYYELIVLQHQHLMGSI